ncbi:MAG: DUF3500 domain-containing protein [Pirellulales bacterium]
MNRRPQLVWMCLPLVALAAGFAYLKTETSGAAMTAAAEQFVASLTEAQRPQAVLAYDTPLRTDWHYIPKPSRKGLQVREMTEPQRKAAHALLQAALSATGYSKADKIMQLEKILNELEQGRANRMIRDPERYYFTLFGQPTTGGRWGLSVEGHHLSLNFVVDKNGVVSSTPTFFGANPGTLMADYGAGFPKGLRVLAKEEELAFQLLDALTPEQRQTVTIADKAPGDVRDAGKAAPPLSPAQGLAARDMTPAQTAILRELIQTYANNLPADVAAERLSAIEGAGFDGIQFAWAGAHQPGTGHHYLVQGATFLIEFNNTQPDSAGNVANHIHSVWHDLAGNFAIPVTSTKQGSSKP